ncbi:exocyst complex component 7 [Anastrepha obliqua]|uniref:exocyst complex component 7 n=1 Tax=Anastrepha obliqua TaxID=95512 RepID=UPI0023AEAC69|nr:exocyst complex component 7 isoform X2 [Anastrepha ludens]XP_054733435.1 exocyst complex component 7 [Anastrepha obliqua]
MNNLDSCGQAFSKLEKETSNLALLRDRVEKYHDLSTQMSSILTVFEQRLGKLEQTILPVYKETEQLQKRQQNLDTTLGCLETVLAHYDVSQEVCNLVHQGPIEGNVNVFLEALGKLRAAMDYFLHHNSQSVELENVTSLFNTGCEGLNQHFRLLLKKHSSPLKPVDLLDLIYIEDDSSDEYTSFRQLSQGTREELGTIAHWLEQNLRREYTIIYATERGEVVLRSLQNLKDHQKSSSWGNEALKPRHSGRSDVKKNTSARLQQIFERKANKLYLRATQTLEQSTGISIKKASTHSEHLSAEEFVDGDQELDKYLVMLLGLQRLLNWERALMTEIVPTSKHGEVFSKLAYNSIELVVKDAEAITNRIMRCISRKEWTSALGIFSALKRVILLQPDIERTYDSQQREQLTKVLNKLQATGAKALEHFLEVVKGESGTNIVGMSSSTLGYGYVNVPKDATVHELTSNTIWFIEHLYDHYDVIGSILHQDVLYSTQLDTILMKKALPGEERNKALLAIYIKKALAELNLSIMNKCEQYNDQATKHLFRLNNIHYILKSLQQSNLIDLVTLAEPECEQCYLDMIRELKFSYQKTWSKMLVSIGVDELPRPSHGKVKDKDRSILKERFSTFNKDFEEACKMQRGISIPDVILREGIKRDNVEHILPKYNRFYEMYASVQFSKNPDKYVKYRPHEINQMLSKLFDDSA